MQRIIKIVGLPGTGKTTTLSKIIANKLNTGLQPTDIMYSSFSRATAKAIFDKMEPLGYRGRQDLPYFRTLHALARLALDLNKRNFVSAEDKLHFCRDNGIPWKTERTKTIDEIEQFGIVGTEFEPEVGNTLFRWWQTLKKLHVYDDPVRSAILKQESLSPLEVRALSGVPPRLTLDWYLAWEDHKERTVKYEFDDMLQKVVADEIGFPDNISCMVIDEAQDLSYLQFSMVKEWLLDVDEAYFAYDTLQAIYFFNAVDPSLIAGLDGEERILERSYRVPRVPWECARDIAHLMGNTTMDLVAPAEGEGSVEFIDYHRAMHQVLRDERKTFLLFRTHAHIARFLNALEAEGTLTRGIGRTRTVADSPTFRAVRNLLHALYRDDAVNPLDTVRLVSALPAKYMRERGMKTAIKRGDYDLVDSMQTTLDGGTATGFYSLFRDADCTQDVKHMLEDPKTRIVGKNALLGITRDRPLNVCDNVFVGTLFAVKGLDAYNVYLFDYLPHQEANIIRDECSLNFVGVTRTRDKLFIVSPTYLTDRRFGEGLVYDIIEGRVN